jgi:hypothetical protein
MKRLEDPAVAMDAGALVRRAHELGLELQSYDPNQLVVDVEDLLRRRGLSPDSHGRRGMAVGASGALLRAFGILPAGSSQLIDRLNARDVDER